jgi:hypothetical protein
MIDPARYDTARDRIAADGLSSDIQSKVSLLLCAAKNANLLFQNQVQWLPSLGVSQQFFISQAFRECEEVTLLMRTTQWTPNIVLLLQAQRIVFPLLAAWGEALRFPGVLLDHSAFYRGISLGHAQLARIRLTPILPDKLDPFTPYALVLQRIEQENSRMLQTQIRLLKNLGTDLPLEERETLIERDQEIVDGVFSNFLNWLSTS